MSRPSDRLVQRCLSVVMLMVCAVPGSAQQLLEPSSELSGYVRLLELEGKISGTPLVYWASSLKPRADGLIADTSQLWSARYPLRPSTAASRSLMVSALDPQLTFAYNSAFPRTSNDGALWAGKGASTMVQAGGELTWGPLTARLYPALVYAANASFPLGSGPQSFRSPYAYPWENGIDYPQRFGNSALRFADWGQSELRLDYRKFTIGFSTENLWWGPGYRNAIIMSNTAPGVPHLDLGTGTPIDTRIGAFEIRAISGALSRSQFFGDSAGEGRRILNGITVGYRPRFLPGLTLGVTRALYHEWPKTGLTASDFSDVFGGLFNQGTVEPDGSHQNDNRDQLASGIARWVLPASEFEVYVELARNDFAGTLEDLVIEPDHSQATTYGFQKALPAHDGRFLLKGEITSLGRGPTDLLRAEPTFYVHPLVIEGYTNRGQLLGAAIGPGSNSQYLGLDRYEGRGRWGVFVERIRYDDDYAFQALQGVPDGYLSHQVDLTIGGSVLRFMGPVDAGGGVELTRELNRYFIHNRDETNLKVTLNVGWNREAKR